jgi:adenine-specific DNA-methyltransferase
MTQEGDLILDSFLGSGTTIATAHKMRRRWIGIERGEQAYTHCKVRIDKVIKGDDDLGISSEFNWQGGGGYKFYELAPSLIKYDAFSQEVINNAYNPDMLASAIALHEGYKYDPNQTVFWKQSTNGDSSYLFVTTKHLDRNYLDLIYGQMDEKEFLIISCKSFESNIQHLYKNISIKRIPQSILKNCVFDVDNYNLNIINPPIYEDS